MTKVFCSDTEKWKTTPPTWWTHCQSLKKCTTGEENVRILVVIHIFLHLCGCLSVYMNKWISIYLFEKVFHFLHLILTARIIRSFSKSHHVKLFIFFWKVVFWASFEKRFVVSNQWPSDFKIHDFILTPLHLCNDVHKNLPHSSNRIVLIKRIWLKGIEEPSVAYVFKTFVIFF